MKVDFPEGLEVRISQMALEVGSTAESLVIRAVEEFVQQERDRVLPARHLAGGIITPQ